MKRRPCQSVSPHPRGLNKYGSSTYLIGVVSNHDLDLLIELATRQQLSRKSGSEIAINNRSICETTVASQTDSDSVGKLQLSSREVASLLNARNIQQGEVVLESLLLLVARGNRHEPRRLRNGLSERNTALFSTVRGDLRHDASTTSALTKHSNTIRVTTELGNVLLDPLESEALIVKTRVGSAVFLESRARQPAERAESVVERNVDHSVVVFAILAASEQTGRVIAGSLGTGSVTATVDPNEHGSTLALLGLLVEDLLRNDDVKEQAVLGCAGVDRRDDRSVESVDVDVVDGDAGRKSSVKLRLVELPVIGGQVLDEKLLGNKVPQRVGLRTNGLAPVELNCRAVLGRWLRSIEAVLARRRSSVTDVGEAVQTSRVVEGVSTVNLVSKIDLGQLILLRRSSKSQCWQQSCQRRDSSREPHRCRDSSVSLTQTKMLSSH